MRSKISATRLPGITSIAVRATAFSRALTLILIALLWLAAIHPVSAAATETILHDFFLGDASNPSAGVIVGKKNFLYGMTPLGGDFSLGTIYRVGTITGEDEILYSFSDGDDGGDPQGTLVMDKQGNFYGSACLDGANNAGTVFKLSASSTFTVIYPFKGGSDGDCPNGGMVFDKLGNLYGTTFRGGASNLGTIFKLTPSGTHTVLYSFAGGSDGDSPNGGLTIDGKGNLYGTSGGGLYGYGTLFSFSTSRVHTVQWNFSNGADGAGPTPGLALYKGIYFGTTSGGGTGGTGVVYGWSPTHPHGLGIYWAFTGGTDAANPSTGVVSDKKGNLYGATRSGGTNFLGTVFKLQVAVAPITETILHSFELDPDGQFPRGGVVLDKAGNLYGTTSIGGTDPDCEPGYGCGVVFKVTP